MNTHASLHSCGGTLLFVREQDGESYETCSGCSWRYHFDKERQRDDNVLCFSWSG